MDKKWLFLFAFNEINAAIGEDIGITVALLALVFEIVKTLGLRIQETVP